MKIILAQGNPEPEYANTRHNVGFALLSSFVSDHGGEWKTKKAFHADVAELSIHGVKVICLKPTTYYNETGRSARAVIDFYKLDPSTDLLAIHDDLALPFGRLRTRQKGSDAGNNGIKSLNAALGEQYARIRVGIWNELRDKIDDASFVLSKFTKTEAGTIEKTISPEVDRIITQFAIGYFDDTTV